MKQQTLTSLINTITLPLSMLLLLTIGGLLAFGQGRRNRAPIVSNAHAEQRSGTHLVDITYNLEDPDGDTMTLSVQLSADGGKTFNVPAKTFSGDIGVGIASGRGKHIVWDAGVDLPDTDGSKYVAKIIADDGVLNAFPDEIISEKDGARMRLIPAGEFEMGSNDGNDNEKPVHTVYLDAFYIDIYEVTNAQYKKFMDATGQSAPRWFWNNSNFNKPNQPVVGVSWHEAMAYCQWAKKRLPTEAEWEFAARGGLSGKRYPWGDEIDESTANYGKNVGRTTPVGKYPANGYGLYDMAGNVLEWCIDEYDGDFYANSESRNPVAGGLKVSDRTIQYINSISRVLRGGSWNYDDYNRVAFRYSFYPEVKVEIYFGFRGVFPR